MELSKGFGTSGSGGLNWELVLDWELQEEKYTSIGIDISSYDLKEYKLLLLQTSDFYNGNANSATQTLNLVLSFTEKSSPTYSPGRSITLGSIQIGAWQNNLHSGTRNALVLFSISETNILGFSSNISSSSNNITYTVNEIGYYDGIYHKPQFNSINQILLVQENPGSESTMKILPGARIQIYGLK